MGSNPAVVCEKVANDLGLFYYYYYYFKLGLCRGFCWVLRFPPLLTTGLSRWRHNMPEKVLKIEIPMDQLDFCNL